VEDSVRIEILELQTIVEEEPLHEQLHAKPEATLVERSKHHDIAITRQRAPLPFSSEHQLEIGSGGRNPFASKSSSWSQVMEHRGKVAMGPAGGNRKGVKKAKEHEAP
jgi:hypothetical protein